MVDASREGTGRVNTATIAEAATLDRMPEVTSTIPTRLEVNVTKVD